MRFLLFILFVIPALTYGQQYTPMVVEGAQWVMYQNAPVSPSRTFFGYVIKGDSIVNGKTYKKVFYREYYYEVGNYTPPFELLEEEFYALIREDTIARKVYAIGAEYNDWNYPCWPDTSRERVWYDFSKEIGDTLIDQCIYPISKGNPVILDSISIDNYYGYDRRTYHGYYWLDSVWKSTVDPYIVEGIGSTRGLFDPAVGWPYLTTEAIGLVYYCIGSDADCQIITSIAQANLIPHSIYPNPVCDQLRFQLGPEVEYPLHLTIYNQLGQEMNVMKIRSSHSEFPVEKLIPGLYSYTLVHRGQWVGKGRFVKK